MMRRYAQTVFAAWVVSAVLFALGGAVYGQDPGILFAGVTHVNTLDGRKTNLDLGIDVPKESVVGAYVTGPHGFSYEYDLIADYLPAFREFFEALDGPPALGQYTFYLQLDSGTTKSAKDTQGPLEILPILTKTQYEITGGDGTMPTFRWPAVEGRLFFYRARIFDASGNIVFTTPRMAGTSCVIPPGTLQPYTDYRFRVEIHDSRPFDTLNNRSNGEMLCFTTGGAPGGPTGVLKSCTVPRVTGSPLNPHDRYNGKTITSTAVAGGGDGTYAREWVFVADGVYEDVSKTSDNADDLSATHPYPDRQFDKIFIARIRVRSGCLLYGVLEKRIPGAAGPAVRAERPGRGNGRVYDATTEP